MPAEWEEKSHLHALVYRITVSGRVDPSWSEWFSDMKLTAGVDKYGNPITRLTGILPDQGALRGVINKLWDLNLTLRSVESGKNIRR